MGRIYSENEHYFFDTQEEPPFVIELNENNLLGNKFRKLGHFLMERVAIEDPRDEAWWSWYRYDTPQDQFEMMMSIVLEAGSLLIRDTAPEELQSLFYNRHQFEEGEFDELLGDDDVPGN